MTKEYSKIIFRFLRNHRREDDDVIVIAPTATNEWKQKITHTVPAAATLGNCSQVLVSEVNSKEALQTYMTTLLICIENDIEPQDSINLQLPLIPEILVKPNQLMCLIYPIRNFFGELASRQSWPTMNVEPNPVFQRSRAPSPERTRHTLSSQSPWPSSSVVPPVVQPTILPTHIWFDANGQPTQKLS